MYSIVREVAVKNTTIFVGTIIYQLHVSALIGHLQVGIQRQRKISIISIGMGDEISFTNVWGFWSNRGWSKHVFAWCVHQLGSRGWVLKHWWPGVTMVGWSSRVPLWRVLSRAGRSGERLASLLKVGSLIRKKPTVTLQRIFLKLTVKMLKLQIISPVRPIAECVEFHRSHSLSQPVQFV